MKINSLLQGILMTAFMLVTMPLRPQSVISTEIGVDEHLDSIIPLNLTFMSEQNKPVRLGDIFNKPTILTLVYFDCPGLCSPLLEGLGSVMQKTKLELGKDYQVITISFNFRDTPEKAKAKKDKFVDLAKWVKKY